MLELSTTPFENLFFLTCWKTAYAFLYLNRNADAKYQNARFQTSRVGQVPAMPLRNIKLRQLKIHGIAICSNSIGIVWQFITILEQLITVYNNLYQCYSILYTIYTYVYLYTYIYIYNI